jgi:ribonuclease HIII
MKRNCLSTKIDPKLADKLKHDLTEQGFSFTKPVNTIFSAKKKGIVCTLYESGSLLVQGKEKEEFIEFYLEPEILKEFSYTNPQINVDFTDRIGVDEAGKGDFFGPLVIAGVFADKQAIEKLIDLGIKDSKKVTDKSATKLAAEIKKHAKYSIIRLFPQKYNELYSQFNNLNSLLAWGHATVITNLQEKTGAKNAIIDQFANKRVVEDAIKRKKIDINLTQRFKGEEDIVVAAASILARDGFLDGMQLLSDDIDETLPKGAANHIIGIGKKILAKHGKAIFEKIAKLHFKTYTQILS